MRGPLRKGPLIGATEGGAEIGAPMSGDLTKREVDTERGRCTLRGSPLRGGQLREVVTH